MEIVYCWRVREFLAMLDEDEWEEMHPYLNDTINRIKEYREKHNCDLATAKKNFNLEATNKFEELTGYKDIPYDLIFYLRRSDYGPQCQHCNKVLRTPKAKFCAECGRKNQILHER